MIMTIPRRKSIDWIRVVDVDNEAVRVMALRIKIVIVVKYNKNNF